MQTVTDFPFQTEVLDPVFIEMSDGVRLAAKIWLPKGASAAPVPAIFEFLPYRRGDGTAPRDALTHGYFAGHGYACIRVDMRGSGDSDGILLGEYLAQEQSDALEVIDWIARQPWCTGKLGMIGISWGGFNGLQVAAHQPEALKAVVTICSTDDRYADDIHYMGGCMLADNPWWNSYMFAINSAPPDPAVVGNRWQEMWLERLEKTGFWLEEWLQHQRRDAYWEHGSICEDYGAIKAAVLAVGGWADGYSNAVFRMLDGLEAPVKGLVGPWAHKYPHFAQPGPQIGFLQECLRWWDHWLKGVDTGVADDPALRAYLQDPVPPRPHYAHRPGLWVAEAQWPPVNAPERRYHLNSTGLEAEMGAPQQMRIRSPLSVGAFGGHWCAFGINPDLPGDQRGEMGGSLVFDTAPLEAGFDVLGAPELELELSSDTAVAQVIAVLSDVGLDGAATRVSFGVLNLTHRDSHAHPQPLEPGKRHHLCLRLNECGQRFSAGHRLRIALSTSYWPMVWPAPEATTLSVTAGASLLRLPERAARPQDAEPPAFAPPEAAPPLPMTQIEPPRFESRITHDVVSGHQTHYRLTDEGVTRFDTKDGWSVAKRREERYHIHPDDPASAALTVECNERYSRAAWSVETRSYSRMTCDGSNFYLEAVLEASMDGVKLFEKTWEFAVPRDLN